MFFLCIISIILITFYSFLSTRKPRKYPPGPKWLPIMGSASLMKKLSIEHGGMHKAVEKLNEDYQTNILGLKLGKDNVVVISSYELLKDTLWREEFEGKPDTFFVRLRCMGTRKGITMTDGHFSKIQRNFVKSHLRELGFGKEYMETLLRDEFREILQIIEENIDNGIEFSKLLPLSVINVIWAISSGFRMSRNDQRLMSLLNIMKERSQLFDMAGGLLNQVPWLRYIAPEKTGYNMIKKLNKQLNILIMQSIDEHKQTWTPGRKDDLVYAFVSQMNKENVDNTTFTEEQLVMICLDLFIAGSVSTGNTLDYAFLMMILYPDIQTKVQLAIDEVFQKCEQISYKDRNRIPYVEAVLNEIQRFCGVGPIGGPRRATKDVELEEYIIPKDTTVLFSIYSSHNDKEYWKDPEVFRPDRFLSEDGTLINHNRFMPFSIGVRRCLGEVLAKTCVFTFFAETLRQYNLSAYPGMPKPTGKIIPGMLTGPEKYKAKLTRRT